MTVDLRLGDCVDVMATLPENSVDSIVCDPPYGLEFMGREWDSLHLNEPFSDAEAGGLGGYKHHIRYGADGRAMQDWHTAWALAALRVAKPGAILMAFGGTRTVHRLACAIEDAGWEIKDKMCWLHGQGFPKSMAIDKAIDRAAGAEREVVDTYETHDIRNAGLMDRKPSLTVSRTAPATPLAQLWEGWGTALKPAYEDIIIAQKPLDGTYAHNAETWGVAGLWIGGSKIGYEQGGNAASNPLYRKENGYKTNHGVDINSSSYVLKREPGQMNIDPAGRWPANLVLDEEAAALLGAPSRFFYCAKASKREREMGLEGMEKQMQLRDDLTPEQRAYVTSELERCGVRL